MGATQSFAVEHLHASGAVPIRVTETRWRLHDSRGPICREITRNRLDIWTAEQDAALVARGGVSSR
jgi:hypothetical protein